MNKARCSANNSKDKNFDLKNALMLLFIFIVVLVVWYLIIKFGIIPLWNLLQKFLKGFFNVWVYFKRNGICNLNYSFFLL